MTVDKYTVPKLKSNIKWRAYLKGIIVEPELALNESAAFIFRLINGQNSIDNIRKEMSNNYASIKEEELLKDIIDLIDRLVEEKIVKNVR